MRQSRRSRLPVAWALLALAVLGCAKPEGSSQEEPTEAARVPVRFVRVQLPRDRSLLEAPATARANPDTSGEVSALTRLSIKKVLVRVGQTVAAGEPVLEAVAPQILEAAASYSSAATQKKLHEERAVELEALRAEGLSTKAEVLRESMQARTLAAEQLRASAVLLGSGVPLGEAGRLLGRGYVTLNAPVAGVVSEISARPGMTYDGAPTPLLRIVGIGVARIEVRSMARLPAVQRANFVAVDGRTFELVGQPLATVVAPGDGTVTSWYELVGTPQLPDGLRGSIHLINADDVWQVPGFALGRQGDKNLVLRRRQGKIEAVSVEVVSATGTSALVRGELAADDDVAADYQAASSEPPSGP